MIRIPPQSATGRETVSGLPPASMSAQALEMNMQDLLDRQLARTLRQAALEGWVGSFSDAMRLARDGSR
jgi:hypothetical protein